MCLAQPALGATNGIHRRTAVVAGPGRSTQSERPAHHDRRRAIRNAVVREGRSARHSRERSQERYSLRTNPYGSGSAARLFEFRRVAKRQRPRPSRSRHYSYLAGQYDVWSANELPDQSVNLIELHLDLSHASKLESQFLADLHKLILYHCEHFRSAKSDARWPRCPRRARHAALSTYAASATRSRSSSCAAFCAGIAFGQ